jgi:hypothetical protein
MRVACAALVLVAAPGVSVAQTSPGDFARAATIRVEPGGSVFRVRLPDDVYATVARRDLADLRVFNAAGEPLPHTLRAVPPAQTEGDWRSVPVFAVTEASRGGTVARTQVKVGTDGAVIEVTGDTGVPRAPTAYLLDASARTGAIASLKLSWKAPAGASFLARISVRGSDDLDRWRTLVSSAAIAQLQHDTATLTQSTVDLPSGTGARYLQITWPRELAAVTLTGVRLRAPATVANPEIQWRTLLPEQTSAPGIVDYDTQGLFPIEHVQIEFVELTDAALVRVRSRPGTSEDWALRHSGIFYAVDDPGGAIRNPPARIALTSDRHWRVETTAERGWSSGRAPRLLVGWYPHELVFLAQGPPPYTLVYGSARVGAADAPVDALLARLEEASRTSRVFVATLDEPRTAGGADALKPAPPVRRMVLWAVLIAAVAVLAMLALRVVRTTSAPPSASK